MNTKAIDSYKLAAGSALKYLVSNRFASAGSMVQGTDTVVSGTGHVDGSAEKHYYDAQHGWVMFDNGAGSGTCSWVKSGASIDSILSEMFRADEIDVASAGSCCF